MPELFENVDCIELYVSDLDEGIRCYRDSYGLALLWRADDSAGLGMPHGITEIVLQTARKKMNVDFKVPSVVDAIRRIVEAGGTVVTGPFDIPIGKCAVVRDPWQNEYVILDMSKGRYVTDASGNVIGLEKDV